MTKEEQEFKNECDEKLYSIYSKIAEEEKIFLSYLVNQFNNICERNNKAIEYIKKHEFDLNDEVEITEEDTFEDIEPLVLKTFGRTGEAVTIDRFEDYSFDNFRLLEDTLSKVILNQKKIINMLKEDK